MAPVLETWRRPIGCATAGVNIIVHGLPLSKGDEVITSTHEHVAVNTALLHRFCTSSTHRWPMGPKRTGFLNVRQGPLDAPRPLTVGMGSTSHNDIASSEVAFAPTAQRDGCGTQHDALSFALGTAIDVVQAIGVERRRRGSQACLAMSRSR